MLGSAIPNLPAAANLLRPNHLTVDTAELDKLAETDRRAQPSPRCQMNSNHIVHVR